MEPPFEHPQTKAAAKSKLEDQLRDAIKASTTAVTRRMRMPCGIGNSFCFTANGIQ